MSSPELTEEQKLRYFEDIECSKPLTTISFPEPVIRGEEKTELTVYAKNVTTEELDKLQFVSNNPDLKITSSQDKVEAHGLIQLKFVFEPSKSRSKKLDSTFVVKGRAIIR